MVVQMCADFSNSKFVGTDFTGRYLSCIWYRYMARIRYWLIQYVGYGCYRLISAGYSCHGVSGCGDGKEKVWWSALYNLCTVHETSEIADGQPLLKTSRIRPSTCVLADTWYLLSTSGWLRLTAWYWLVPVQYNIAWGTFGAITKYFLLYMP